MASAQRFDFHPDSLRNAPFTVVEFIATTYRWRQCQSPLERKLL